jgi:hypothetical protein
LAEVALRAGSGRAGGVADTVISELSGRAVDGGSDADSIGEIVAGVAGITEGVGEAAEAVGGAALADSVLGVGVGS